MKFNDNIKKMLEDHNGMKSWHETKAKEAAELMQDHIKASSWHESQMNLIKAMTEVPLDPEEKKTTIPAGSYSAPAPSGVRPQSTEVPLDPSTVKKSDLIKVLSDHVEIHGEFDMDIETIANFLLNS